MYSDDELESAVHAGALTREAAAAFRAHVSATHATTVVDEEHFRLITSFNAVESSSNLAAAKASGSSITPVMQPRMDAPSGFFVAWQSTQQIELIVGPHCDHVRHSVRQRKKRGDGTDVPDVFIAELMLA